MIHWEIAEAGKAAMLDRDYAEALRQFREAIRLAVSSHAPEVFFRHYMQCVLEALELAGDYDEVIALCREQDSYYQALDRSEPLLAKDHGSILEKLGIALLLNGERQEAIETFERAVERASPCVLPLAQLLLGWLRRGLVVPLGQLRQVQHQQHYFVVRPETVNRGLARAYPGAATSQPAALL